MLTRYDRHRREVAVRRKPPGALRNRTACAVPPKFPGFLFSEAALMKLKQISILTVCLFLPADSVFSREPCELPRYPLKNGDFSTYQGWARPAGWLLASEAGEHKLTVDPVPRQPTQSPSVAVVSSESAGQGYVWQTVKLLAGAWRLRVEVAGSDGAKAQLEVSRSVSAQSDPVAVSGEW